MNLSFLSKTALFRGCSDGDISKMVEHLGFRTAGYEKEKVIFREGSAVTEIGILLSGSIRVEHTDVWGNKSILGIVETGGVFGEAYACVPNEPMMVDAVANEDCEILFISVPRLFTPCPVCQGQNKLIQNLVMVSARKNLQLSKRSLHTSPKTIRGRLLSYFSQEISAQGSTKITIPFDRQQLADYLNLDRSALSKELGKMRREGLLEYRKNTFELKMDVEPR